MDVSDATYSVVDKTRKNKKKKHSFVPSEASVVESTADTPVNDFYAVVDKKKKWKKTDRAGPPEERVIESTAEPPALYAVVDKKKETKTKTRPPHPPKYEGNIKDLYSKTNPEQGIAGTSEKIDYTMSCSANFVSDKKYFICLLVTVIVMAVIMSVCFIAAFVRISNVRSATMSSDQQVSVENITAIISGITAMIFDQQQLLWQLSQNISTISFTSQQLLEVQNGQLFTTPASSCAAVFLLAPSSPSGYYWIRSSNGSVVSVYCDMTRSCGNIAGGWTRVAELDMTDRSSQCPSGFRLRTDSNICTCAGTNTSRSCSSVIFPTAVQYSMVCGKIIAYQVGTTNAFADVHRSRVNPTIDTDYVDGVSLTHGSNPRQHIWTFAAALNEVNTSTASNCPCFSNSNTTNPPATPAPNYVGEDYFCDTGSHDHVNSSVFYSDDPLWDGAGCEGYNTCCSFNNPPWFYKQLSQPTTDDIEMRVCRDESVINEDIAIENIELYVQ